MVWQTVADGLRPKLRRVRRPSDASLNLVPLLTLIAMLIPFVLLSGKYASYSVIDATAPKLRRAEAGEEGIAAVVVRADTSGFHIWGEEDVLTTDMATVPCETQPCVDSGSYDYAGLKARLAVEKAARPLRREVVLAPMSLVPYDVIVRVIDAVRRTDPGPGRPGTELFPVVSFSAAGE